MDTSKKYYEDEIAKIKKSNKDKIKTKNESFEIKWELLNKEYVEKV